MQKKKAPKVDPSELKEVVEFLDAQDALNTFKEEYAEVFEQLSALAERYNSTLEQAEQACRTRKVTCGPFNLYQFVTRYDANALHDAVGRDQFLAIGGKIETQTVYDVDKGRLEASIAQKKISEEVVNQVRKETPNFHKPNILVIP